MRCAATVWRQVENPSAVFLEERVINAPGSAIAVTMEGSRPLLVELQALTSPSAFGNPRRTPNGIDINRLLLISAVLSKRIGLKLWEQDIFVNVIGGMRISEPASDLALALAIASSYFRSRAAGRYRACGRGRLERRSQTRGPVGGEIK